MPTEVVQTAAQQSGWVAALLAAIVLAGFSVLGYIVRQLWNDHRELNAFCREKLAKLVETVCRAVDKADRVFDLMENRECVAKDLEDIRRIRREPPPAKSDA